VNIFAGIIISFVRFADITAAAVIIVVVTYLADTTLATLFNTSSLANITLSAVVVIIISVVHAYLVVVNVIVTGMVIITIARRGRVVSIFVVVIVVYNMIADYDVLVGTHVFSTIVAAIIIVVTKVRSCDIKKR
jgi:hypothetical protein